MLDSEIVASLETRANNYAIRLTEEALKESSEQKLLRVSELKHQSQVIGTLLHSISLSKRKLNFCNGCRLGSSRTIFLCEKISRVRVPHNLCLVPRVRFCIPYVHTIRVLFALFDALQRSQYYR